MTMLAIVRLLKIIIIEVMILYFFIYAVSEHHTPVLDQVLGTGSSGASKHLGQIAESMYEWEGLVADQLGLSLADVNNIRTKYHKELTLQA